MVTIYKVNNKRAPKFWQTGFNMSDGDVILQMSIGEWHNLVQKGFFQVVGYCALRMSEIISRSKVGQYGELTENTQQQLAVSGNVYRVS